MADSTNLELALKRAVQRDLPLTAAERREVPGYVPIVLNPGSRTGIAREKVYPGQLIYVDPDQAERLTRPSKWRTMPVARHLDDPEPDTRGNFPQVHGAGAFHPESKHHKDPAAEPVTPGEGQVVTEGGELVEPAGSTPGNTPGGVEGDDEVPTPSRPRQSGKPKGQPTPVGDGGKS